MMSSTIITPFCVTMGQKMSEFRKALFIVSFSLIVLTMVISTEILQKIYFFNTQSQFLFTHDGQRAWQNSN